MDICQFLRLFNIVIIEMINYKEIERLEEYVKYTNDELGELCSAMLNLNGRSGMSKELEKLLEEEILANLKWFDENMEFVETTETYTKTYRELVEKEC